MEQQYDLKTLIKQLYKWRQKLLLGMVFITLLSIVIAFLLPNYYKAETTFYAASPDLAKPIPIGDDEKDFGIYGDDNDLDRLFTIASSHELLTFLIDSFDLYTHYDIDKSDPKSAFKVKEELLENFTTIKTKYKALHLMVEDKNPEIAAAIANAARNKISDIAQLVVKSSQSRLIENYAQNINIKLTQGDSLAKQLERIKTLLGAYEWRSQSAVYTQMLVQSTSEYEDAKGKILFYKDYPSKKDSLIKYKGVELGANEKIKKAKAELEKIAPFTSQLRQLEQEQARLQDQVSLDKERLKQLNATFSSPFTSIHIIEEAFVPVQKSRPKRSILIIISVLTGFVMLSLAILIIENSKEFTID